jgi:hypothetical protein
MEIARDYLLVLRGPYVSGRLLARVLKESVQFLYNETSTVKGGGVETFLWKTFEVYVTQFTSVSVPSSFEIFQTHLAL